MLPRLAPVVLWISLVGVTGQASADLASIFARPGPGPRLGEVAPAFSLQAIESEALISLPDLYKDRPVALIFGSFT